MVCTVSSTGLDSAQSSGNHGRGKGRTNCSSNDCHRRRCSDSTRLAYWTRCNAFHPSIPMARFFSASCSRRRALSLSPVLFTGQFPDHSLPPSLLQNQVLAFDFLSLLRWHGVIAPQSLLALALFEGLVFSRGLETGDSLVVSLAATGPHILYAVHSRILSGSIPPLAVLFLLHLRVHDSTRTIASSTRRPTHIIARMDFPSPLACPAAGQCALGFCVNTHD